MTTLADRPNTAVLVIDVQNGVVAEAWDRDAVVGRIGELVGRARTADVPVVWVQDHDEDERPVGSTSWDIVPELAVADDDARVRKVHGDSFEDTNLEDVLAGLGVGHLLVAGAQTDACVRATLHGAFVRGYDVTLVGDAHTTEDLTAWGAPLPAQVVAHTNLYWQFQSGPGRRAAVTTVAEAPIG